MNAFESACGIEAQGRALILPYLEARGDALVLTSKGPLARWMQEELGDLVLVRRGQTLVVELKIERHHTGNLFLEIFSNRNTEDRNSWARLGHSMGWLCKCRADWLFYYFLDADVLYMVDLFQLSRWAFGHAGAPARVFRFQEVEQRAYAQRNHTTGSIVSVRALQRELPRGALLMTTIQQLQLAGMEHT